MDTIGFKLPELSINQKVLQEKMKKDASLMSINNGAQFNHKKESFYLNKKNKLEPIKNELPNEKLLFLQTMIDSKLGNNLINLDNKSPS